MTPERDLEREAIQAESTDVRAPCPDLTPTAQAVLDYRARGWYSVQVPHRQKGPRTNAWQDLRLEVTDIPGAFTEDPSNAGLLTGEASGNLVDLDLDCPAALRLARAWAPKTSMKHGRPSTPTSHYWYTAIGKVPYLKLTDPEPPGTTLVELRQDGHQTIVPPSTHPEGELLAWEGPLEPGTVTSEDLVRITKKIAAGALLADRWSKTSTHGAGVGHDATLAIAGFLLRRWSLEQVLDFLGTVAEAAGGDRRKVEADVRDTQHALDAGKNVTGGRKLLDYFTSKVITTITTWLDLDSTEPRQNEPFVDGPLVAPETEPGAPPADWLRPGDGLASRPLPIARVTTGFPTFDAATRGGLPTGSASLTLGPPDSGKTGLAMTEADAAERQGFVVVHIAADGGREAAEIRWAQMMGFDREKLEERDTDGLTRFRAAFAPRNVFLPDPDLLDKHGNPVNTLAHIIETGATVFAGLKVFLLIDSIQTVKPDHGTHDGPRIRMGAVLELVRRASNIPGWHVGATSQTNRASRRHKDDAENSDPMTAGMESGAIEHVFDLMVNLDGDSSAPEGVRARITKNKPGSGRKPIFRLTWSRDRARFTELAAATLEQGTLDMIERYAVERRGAVLVLVTKEPGLSTARVCKQIEGRDSDTVRALQDLKKAGLVYEIRKGNGYYWHPAENTSARNEAGEAP